MSAPTKDPQAGYVLDIPFRDAGTGRIGLVRRPIDVTKDDVAAWMCGQREWLELYVLARSKMYER